MMRNYLCAILMAICCMMNANAETVLTVPASNDADATAALRAAFDKAASYRGKPVTIRLEAGDYPLSRDASTRQLYHISNTTSERENPDPTKHIGLWLKKLKNVTLDGGGACFVTHGEMTLFVLDSCENIVLKNFTVTADDPSVPEMTIEAVGGDYVVARPSSFSHYDIAPDGTLLWVGHGWSFKGGIAQVFYPEHNVTVRCTTPMEGVRRAERLPDGRLKLYYDATPRMHEGEIYHMRHSIRNEVCGFIYRSKNVTLDNIHFEFLGNFGLVGQYSENLTYRHLTCAPRLGSDHTDAGFADFVQMSGCKGKISITDSRFEGAHDDPINIHGTHLRVTGYEGARQVRVRFMHDQSYGFDAFAKGDEIEFVNTHTLRCLLTAAVKKVERQDDYTLLLTLDRDVDEVVRKAADVAVENVTWTPEVVIARNYFARIPTRGILVTTRRRVLIEYNTFYRLPMSGVLVSNDARGWYESGPVRDVTIRGNEFIECGSPNILIDPEVDEYAGAVHRGINIEGNRFRLSGGEAIAARATDDLVIRNNCFETEQDIDSLIRIKQCTGVIIENNRKAVVK